MTIEYISGDVQSGVYTWENNTASDVVKGLHRTQKGGSNELRRTLLDPPLRLGGAVAPPTFGQQHFFSGISHTTDRKVPSEVVLMGSFMSVIYGNVKKSVEL